MNKVRALLLIVLVASVIQVAFCVTCSMQADENVKRAACVASCKVQNCATGYCSGAVCVCSRCDIGHGYPGGK